MLCVYRTVDSFVCERAQATALASIQHIGSTQPKWPPLNTCVQRSSFLFYIYIPISVFEWCTVLRATFTRANDFA